MTASDRLTSPTMMKLDLPPSVYEKSGRYYLVRRENGRQRWIKLTRADKGRHALYAELAKFEKGDKGTVGHLIDVYLAEGMNRLAERTREEYVRSARRLRSVFGHMPVALVEQGHIAQYLYKMECDGTSVAGNRDISTLRSVFQYGMRVGLCQFDPCRGVRRNPEPPRERYVTDDEFLEAIDKTTPAFALLMWMAYLTGLRRGDLIALRKSQVTDDGLKVRESKRGKRVIITWSPTLRALVDDALERWPDSEYLLNNTRGKPWKRYACNSALRRLKLNWTLHDVRAKAESDHKTGLGLLSRYKRSKTLTPVS